MRILPVLARIRNVWSLAEACGTILVSYRISPHIVLSVQNLESEEQEAIFSPQLVLKHRPGRKMI